MTMYSDPPPLPDIIDIDCPDESCANTTAWVTRQSHRSMTVECVACHGRTVIEEEV